MEGVGGGLFALPLEVLLPAVFGFLDWQDPPIVSGSLETVGVYSCPDYLFCLDVGVFYFAPFPLGVVANGYSYL